MKTLSQFVNESIETDDTAVEDITENQEAISEATDVELKPHPNGTHYIVHKIHAKSGIDSDQLKVGEKLSDTHVDDLNDMGYKVKIHKA